MTHTYRRWNLDVSKAQLQSCGTGFVSDAYIGISDQRDHEIRFEGEFTSLNLLLAVLVIFHQQTK